MVSFNGLKILIIFASIFGLSSVRCSNGILGGWKKDLFYKSHTQFNFIFVESTTSKILENDSISNSSEVEDQLIKQIYEIIEHFKQDDPIGLPVPLPDPTVSIKYFYFYGSEGDRF